MKRKLLKVSVHNGRTGERTSAPCLSEGVEQRGHLSGTDYIASLPYESEQPRLAANGLLSLDSVAQGTFHE